jgi:tRNA (guanine-N7-)-methyltransferase
MGRRALGKIQPDEELDSHFLELESLASPFGFGPFAEERPLEVEVGSGKGLFLRTAAAANPSHNFLGIERAQRYAKYAASNLNAFDLKNAVMLRGDGVQLFSDHLQSQQLEAVHVYFPDPWWKHRHRKRRIMNAEFLKLIEDRLQPKGKLHFWTDVQEYFNSAIAGIQQATKLKGPVNVDEQAPSHDFDYRTHFERRMRRNGKPIYRSLFVK